jgi:hypothetical protein
MTGSAYWKLGSVSMMVSRVYNHHRVDGEERPIYLNMYNMVEQRKNRRMKKRNLIIQALLG